MRLGLSLGFTNRFGSGVVVFSPLSLTPTAWYDPSDMSTLFQDSAGTVPVTATGQPVGRMNDKSGNGFHATQATTAAKPTYTELGGLKYLATDGVDDYLDATGVTLTQDNSIAAAFLKTNAAVQGFIFDGITTRQAMEVASGGAANALQLFAGAAEPTLGTVSSGAAFVAICLFNGVSSNIRLNGVTGANGNPGANSLSGLRIGTFSPGSAHFGGNIYGIIPRDVPFTAGEQAQIDTYLGAKAGLTL